ncbi:hypothetical protein T484DRAFT_1851131 [Baffinella frigidus]|nr:hypothetical protein T484DRAFT_1851131 [Cryptophyta sp. CCMP2293]
MQVVVAASCEDACVCAMLCVDCPTYAGKVAEAAEALLKWGGAEGVTNQMIMEKALKIFVKVKKARNIKGLNASVQEMVKLIPYIPPDQHSDKHISAPALMLRGETAEWFSRIREIIDRNAPASNDDFPAFAKIARANAALVQPWLNTAPVQLVPFPKRRGWEKGNDEGGGEGGESRDTNYHEALRAAVADKQRYFMHDGVFHDSSDGKGVGSQAGAVEDESESDYSGCHAPARARSAR